VCTREHARLNIDLGAERAPAASAPVACGGRVPPMPTATHAALAMTVPSCAVPPMNVARRSEMGLCHSGEDLGYYADKGAAGEVLLPLAGGPGALPTPRRCCLFARLSNRWVLLALVAGLVVAALFVAQAVVHAHGGRVPRISWA